MQLSYGYSAAANNGNIASQTISDGVSWSAAQSYTYDGLNRLLTAQEGIGSASWLQTYGYDQWGNRWVDFNSSNGIGLDSNTPVTSAWFTAKNCLNLAAGSYDVAGNQPRFNP